MKKSLFLSLGCVMMALSACNVTIAPISSQQSVPSSNPPESSSAGQPSSEASVSSQESQAPVSSNPVSSQSEFVSSESVVSTQPVGSSESKSSSSKQSSQQQSTQQQSSQQQSSEPDSSESSEEEMGEGVYHGKIRIWYHRDDMNYGDLRIYLWNSAVDGMEYEWTHEDEEYGVNYEVDLSTSPQFANFPSTDIRLIVKHAGTWGGQSLDTYCTFADYEVGDDGYLNIYTAQGEGTTIDTFAKRSDALGDHFDTCYFDSDWQTIHITGTGTPSGRPDSEVGLIASYEIFAFTTEYYKLRPRVKIEREREFLVKSGILDGGKATKALAVKLDSQIDPTTQYEVRGTFVSDTTKTKAKAVSTRSLFDTAKFKQDYVYDGDDLGVTINADGTKTFKVWAPTSGLVSVRGYLDSTPWNLIGGKVADMRVDFPMNYEGKGVWSLTRSFSWPAYTYVANNSNGVVEAADPYSKATGLNGERSAIVDWDDAETVDPEGWDSGNAIDNALKQKCPIEAANNLSVYEVHIRDLTSDKTWVSNKGNLRGTYKAFAEEGTTYNGVATGFDHIKELGVNAIQLLPVFDNDNDERQSSVYESMENGGVLNGATYNWGYNPLNYNSVDGAYSSDPENPLSSVLDYKGLIKTAADNGIRVIMDVVYNHMSSVANNSFTKLVPYYFFRTNAQGLYTDGSGCGNEFATERPMASKFIVDSVKWWSSEYHVKGFRFDLMGCIDINTMKAIRAAVNKIDPQIVLYGEGWTGGGTALSGDLQSGTNNVYKNLNTNEKFPVGCFNDAGRDGCKGNTVWADVVPAGGWINEGSNVDNVYNALTQIIGENRWAKQACGGDSFNMNPNQTVNYLACHDNYTLYDQINYLFYGHDKTFGDGTHEYVMQAAVALTGLSLMGQGIGFIHGGDEFFRQKVMYSDDELFPVLKESYKHATNGVDNWIEGDGIEINKDAWLVRNSYKYGDNVNGFKWDRKADATVNKYYQSIKDMVHLRAEEMGNTLGQTISQIKADGTTCWSYKDLFNEDDGSSKTDLLAGAYKGQKDGKYVYIFVNKGNYDASIGIGNGSMKVLYSSTSDRKAGDTFSITDNSITVPKFGCLIVRAG